MPKPQDIKSTPPKVLIYSPPGEGKTALLETLGSRLLLLDLDLHAAGVATTFRDEFLKDRIEIDVEVFPETDPIKGTAFLRFKERVYDIVNTIRLNPKAFKKTVVGVDSITSMTAAAGRYILGNSSRLPDSGAKPWTNITQPEWGLMFSELLNIISLLRSIPLPVIYTAHHQASAVVSASEIEIMAPGKSMPNQIASLMDEIWFMRKNASTTPSGIVYERVLQTASDSKIMARSCYNLPPLVKVSHGLPKIFEMMGHPIPLSTP